MYRLFSLPSRTTCPRSADRRKLVHFHLLVVGVVLVLCAASAGAQLFPPPEPAGNALTESKANLGKVLFWDEQLSSTRTVSCGTCHIPTAGGSDPRALGNPAATHPGPDGIFGNEDDVQGSPGVPSSDDSGFYLLSTHFGLTPQSTGRRTMSSINSGYSSTLFWDGRAGSQFLDPVTEEEVLATGAALESQAVGPILSDVEMASLDRAWSQVVSQLESSAPLALAPNAPLALLKWVDGRSYAELFEDAFGTTEISPARIGMAIASYERTQFTNMAPFDEFLFGADVLTPEEVAGRTVFTSSSCDRCHSLALTSDNMFHYTGVRPSGEDVGRFEVTGDPDDMGRMRTPSLRNLELRPPYMHNGRFDTVADVVDFYDRGGDFDAPNKDNRVRELFLTAEEKSNLIAFLTRPLTDPRLAAGVAPFDRPALYTESSQVPSVEGTGVAGSGGLVPEVIALEPPLVGNPNFTVAVQGALGEANALLVIDGSDPGLVTPTEGEFAFESIVLEGSGQGNGFGSVTLAIPSDLSMVGSEWFGRWYVEDTGGGGTTAVSELFRFEIFGTLGDSVLFLDDFESGDTAQWSNTLP